ncbi:MAG: hypothetical protein JWP69_752 [Flaviaesturariibacter sp.]|nr:hypothetical protein [Flaviaesturariibacter sp.]
MPLHISSCFRPLLLLAFLFFSITLHAQLPASDSIIRLEEVTVRAFEQTRKLKETPAAINYINRQALERFSPTAVVAAVNTMPGVRMEERSPGSYRINIRGSSLRSPFGVRNVKVYYNDLPFTDPGGVTYLNSLGYYNFNSVSIIKGPGSSLYGAGTGGVMQIESISANETPGIAAAYTTGSYNLHNAYASFATVSDKGISKGSFQHQQNSGYRDQSALRRDVLSWNGQFTLGESKRLKTSFLYSDLEYETPGALTEAEAKNNPKASRPAGGGFPSAIYAKAAIYQKTFMAGASYSQPLIKNLLSKTALYGAYTQLLNPAIRNYGRNSEPHVGGRTVVQWKPSRFSIDAGAEWQQGFANYSIHKNVGGVADSLQSYDEVTNRQSLAFAQATLDLDSWTFTAGMSLNNIKSSFRGFIPTTKPQINYRVRNEFTPRFAIMKKFKTVNIYSSVSKGFSPPTSAELLPTGGVLNLNLNPESGTNYDIGLKGTLVPGLYLDVNAFYFSLQNTIVRRVDAGGGDFYVNAGNTGQYGVETHLEYSLSKPASWQKSSIWLSHTLHQFRYKQFKQGNTDFSGNRLPGTTPHTVATGMDWMIRSNVQVSISYFFSDKLPLNDANTAYADAYHLLGAKLGYSVNFARLFTSRFAVGADNLLNQRYTLGADVNGFGGRYYNPAPGRNFYVSASFQLAKKKELQN